MTQLLGVCGRAGSGKDTFARGLTLFNKDWKRMAFADPLKLTCAATFGIDMEWFTDPCLKGTTHPFWGITPRSMLQRMGNQAVKKVFTDDHWVRRWEMEYREVIRSSNVIVTDVRHDVEADRIRALGGTIVLLSDHRAYALTGPEASHSSEAGITFHPDDIHINNDGTVADLWHKANVIRLRPLLRGDFKAIAS